MRFSTDVFVKPFPRKIDYESQIVSLGSCFATHIAEKLAYYQFQNKANPFGILFHPPAINKVIGRAISGEEYSEKDLVFYGDLWHSFEVHSEMSHPSKEIILNNLENARQELLRALQEATHIIITYGTAWVYREKTSGDLVANCHKIPQASFDKELLSVESIRLSVRETLESIRKVNAAAVIVFTVSPVRHIKDGIVENQRSKSHLIAGLHDVIDGEPNENTIYFPSYEIMMDELRDYRFYADDLIHPSSMAVDYIWERFKENAISVESYEVMKEVEYIRKGLAHRPFYPDTASHKIFLKRIEDKKDTLSQKYPFMVF